MAVQRQAQYDKMSPAELKAEKRRILAAMDAKGGDAPVMASQVSYIDTLLKKQGGSSGSNAPAPAPTLAPEVVRSNQYDQMSQQQLEAERNRIQTKIADKGGAENAPTMSQQVQYIDNLLGPGGGAGGGGSTGGGGGTGGGEESEVQRQARYDKMSPEELKAELKRIQDAKAAKGGDTPVMDSQIAYIQGKLGKGGGGGETPGGGGGGGTDIGSTTGPIPGAPTTGNINTPDITTMTPDQRIALLREELGIGEQFGRGIIEDFGLGGDFLGRVSETASPEMLAAIARLKSQADTAGQLTPLEQEAIDRQRAALEGINAEENLALREGAESGLDRATAGLLRNQRAIDARSGVLGPAVAARSNPIMRERVQAQRGLERDLLVQNIAEKAKARQAFTDLVTGRSDETFRRQTSANQNLGTAQMSSDLFARGGQELNQQAKSQELGTRLGALFGGIGATTGMLSGYRAEDFAGKGLDEAKRQFDEYLKSVEKISKQQMDLQNKIYSSL